MKRIATLSLFTLLSIGAASHVYAQSPADTRNARPETPASASAAGGIPWVFQDGSELPDEAFANRGNPESALSVSSEVVNIDLSSPQVMSDLSKALAQNPPAKIIVNCSLGDSVCKQASDMIATSRIPSIETGKGDTLALIYEHVVANACDNRYIDNSRDGDNLNHPSFGCSLRMNSVQMVTDKKQFTNPGLLDFRDGDKAAQNYNTYASPPPPPAQNNAGGLSQQLVTGNSQ